MVTRLGSLYNHDAVTVVRSIDKQSHIDSTRDAPDFSTEDISDGGLIVGPDDGEVDGVDEGIDEGINDGVNDGRDEESSEGVEVLTSVPLGAVGEAVTSAAEVGLGVIGDAVMGTAVTGAAEVGNAVMGVSVLGTIVTGADEAGADETGLTDIGANVVGAIVIGLVVTGPEVKGISPTFGVSLGAVGVSTSIQSVQVATSQPSS